MDPFFSWKDDYHREVEEVLAERQRARERGENVDSSTRHQFSGNIVDFVIPPAGAMAELSTTRRRLLDAETELADLRRRLSEADEVAAREREKRDAIKDAAAKLELEARGAQAELNTEKARLDAAQARAQEAERRVLETAEQEAQRIGAAQREAEQMSARAQEAERLAQERQRSARELLMKYEGLQLEADAKDAEVGALRARLDSALRRSEQAYLHGAAAEVEMREQLTRARAELDIAREQIQVLQGGKEENERLRSDLARAQAALTTLESEVTSRIAAQVADERAAGEAQQRAVEDAIKKLETLSQEAADERAARLNADAVAQTRLTRLRDALGMYRERIRVLVQALKEARTKDQRPAPPPLVAAEAPPPAPPLQMLVAEAQWGALERLAAQRRRVRRVIQVLRDERARRAETPAAAPAIINDETALRSILRSQRRRTRAVISRLRGARELLATTSAVAPAAPPEIVPNDEARRATAAMLRRRARALISRLRQERAAATTPPPAPPPFELQTVSPAPAPAPSAPSDADASMRRVRDELAAYRARIQELVGRLREERSVVEVQRQIAASALEKARDLEKSHRENTTSEIAESHRREAELLGRIREQETAHKAQLEEARHGEADALSRVEAELSRRRVAFEEEQAKAKAELEDVRAKLEAEIDTERKALQQRWKEQSELMEKLRKSSGTDTKPS